MDLLIRGAHLASGQQEQVDIAIEDGLIRAIEAELPDSAKQVIEADGRLVIPAFVNGHLHACKSFWREPLAQLKGQVDLGKTSDRFAWIAEVKQHYTPEDVAERAEQTLRLAIQNGSCALRLFADVDCDAGLRALQGLLRLREKYRAVLNIQVVAFPQNGVFRERESTEQLLQQALQLDLDALGGIPWLEPTQEAQKAHIDLVLSLAQSHGLPAHFVLDDTDDPTSRTAEYVAARTIALNMQGRVNGTQANALAFYHDAHAERVIGLIKAAGMTIFANAHIALITTRIRHQPAVRGMTRVRELLEAGVPVAVAQDDIDNPYYPFGRNDLLEVALFMAHLAQLGWGEDLQQVLQMVTHTPARAIGLNRYGLEVGKRADLVILDAPTWRDAVQFQVEKNWVVLGGRVVAVARREREVYL